MRRIIFGLFLVSLLTVFKGTSAMDLETEDIDKDEPNNVFYEFIENAPINEIEVIHSSGDVISGGISKQIKEKIRLKNYEEAFDLLEQNDLSLQYIEDNIKPDFIQPYSFGSTVNNRTVYVYHLEYDKTNKFRKEWSTSLRVSYRENSNGTFTALSNPTVNVSANFGSAFTEEITNVSTGYRYTSGNRGIDFYASYRVRARIVIPITIGGVEIPLGKWYDWGYVNPTYKLR